VNDLKENMKQRLEAADDPYEIINLMRQILHDLSPAAAQPVDFVRWIPIEQVLPNDYNPNKVAHIEMGLLLKSIEHDGYTQPVVTIYDPEIDKYIIVDGFHRYYIMRLNQEIYDRTQGYLPCVVIEKDINDRMAATIRHNRARGKHTIQGMSSMVFQMLDNGWSDAEICNELGMEPEELLRLKHITGFSKLFEDIEYKKSWKAKSQILIKKRYQEKVEASSLAGDGD